ncbi:hercynylcysteine S-oxide lyase, partial [Phenoliferia sp. Uapishka_3]
MIKVSPAGGSSFSATINHGSPGGSLFIFTHCNFLSPAPTTSQRVLEPPYLAPWTSQTSATLLTVTARVDSRREERTKPRQATTADLPESLAGDSSLRTVMATTEDHAKALYTALVVPHLWAVLLGAGATGVLFMQLVHFFSTTEKLSGRRTFDVCIALIIGASGAALTALDWESIYKIVITHQGDVVYPFIWRKTDYAQLPLIAVMSAAGQTWFLERSWRITGSCWFFGCFSVVVVLVEISASLSSMALGLIHGRDSPYHTTIGALVILQNWAAAAANIVATVVLLWSIRELINMDASPLPRDSPVLSIVRLTFMTGTLSSFTALLGGILYETTESYSNYWAPFMLLLPRLTATVLSRVIGRDSASFSTSDAILKHHTRHHVKGQDYPAVVSASVGAAILGRKLDSEEASVRGTLVTGLTQKDVAFLDEFEGDEYERTSVQIDPLDGSATIAAETYLWKGSMLHRLEPSLWSFADFMRDKAHRWVGQSESDEYAEVDRRRAMGGFTTPPDLSKVAQNGTSDAEALPVFGSQFGKDFWSFEEGWTNVNHGSYGAAPNPVIKAFRDLQDQSAVAPDRWMRIEYMVLLKELRARLGDLVGCDTDDLVMVPNATSGVNAILRSLTTIWEKGDKILYFSTTIYDACEATLQYVVDTHPHLNLTLVQVHLEYPVTHAEVIEATEKVIAEEDVQGGRIRLALIDALSSNPGVIVPWEELTKVFKNHQIVSLIDAAHQIGQLPVNLRESEPDYWVSNCHKWLLGHRGCAVMYVAKANQHLIHSIPIGHSYAQRRASRSGNREWVGEFEWNGTSDFSPYLSVAAALDFRKFCGGEKRITDYCHRLAIEAGEEVAKMLGTETMRNKEGEGELVANMINVRLPITMPSPNLPAAEYNKVLSSQKSYLYMTQIETHKTVAPGFVHAGQWWVRFSAQIYNDIEDFRLVGRVLKQVCEEINEEKYKGMVEMRRK